MIRHRRATSHRMVLVGDEFRGAEETILERPDSHILHAAAGIDVKGAGELPHYLVMRCVSEMKKAKQRPGRSSLGATLTGCYSTLLDSSEGREIPKWLEESSEGGLYFSILRGMVDESKDSEHPKVSRVVERVVRNWKKGEKTLIFCSRINTAQRLHEVINDRIRTELNSMQKERHAASVSLVNLRSRFTGGEGDLIGLGLDRVLWSFFWSGGDAVPFAPTDLEVQVEDFWTIAKLALARGIDLTGERVNRVFINRAIEHAVARRIGSGAIPTGLWRRLLDEIGDETWVDFAYGSDAHQEEETSGVERAGG